VDLLHTEIQTEERDLTTLPNMYMVTHPVRVLRSSGTILSVEVSLGYDVPRPVIEKLLIQAATDTGLESPFVQIRGLGDYSISYAIAGMLTEVKNLLQKRRELRARTIDALHAAGIEIASPAVLSVRQFPQQHVFTPPTCRKIFQRKKPPAPIR
jgi:small-conductance mechanosensitive channel